MRDDDERRAGSDKIDDGRNEPDIEVATGNIVDLDAIADVESIGPGRPRKSDAGNGAGNGNRDSQSVAGKRPRGRPRKDGKPAGSTSDGSSKKQKKADKAALDVPSLTLCVAFATGFVAKVSKEPLLSFDDDESKKTAEAISNVGQYYNVAISPVTQAWMTLGMTIGSICASKIAAVRISRSMKSKTKNENAPNDPTNPDLVFDASNFLKDVNNQNVN